jgi:hypothetical protein
MRLKALWLRAELWLLEGFIRLMERVPRPPD